MIARRITYDGSHFLQMSVNNTGNFLAFLQRASAENVEILTPFRYRPLYF
jgi:hypothetical protein